jgi:four helix bundle protein
MDLATVVCGLTKAFPRSEDYRMTSQLTRSIVSVPANIAEGHARPTARDFANFLHIARGSLAESETYLLLSVRLGYLLEDAICDAMELVDAVGRMLTALRKSISPR